MFHYLARNGAEGNGPEDVEVSQVLAFINTVFTDNRALPILQSYAMLPSDSDCEIIRHKNSLEIFFVPFNIFKLMLSVPEENGNVNVSVIVAVAADVMKIWFISRQARGETVGKLSAPSVVKMEVKLLFVTVGQFSAMIGSLCSSDSLILSGIEREYGGRQTIWGFEMSILVDHY